MRVSGWKLAFALAAGIVATASSARATSITFYLDQTGTGPVGNAGSITLDDTIDPGKINILVTLNPGYEFVKTGAGDALAFNLTGDPSVTIDDITSGFDIGPTNQNEPPFGTFNYAVSCTSGCGKGGSAPDPGPLSFNVVFSGLSLNSFIANDAGYYFASDLIGPSGTSDGRKTGNVGALGSTDITSTSPVPEPASLVLLGTGLAFVGRKLRRRGQNAPTE